MSYYMWLRLYRYGFLEAVFAGETIVQGMIAGGAVGGPVCSQSHILNKQLAQLEIICDRMQTTIEGFDVLLAE